MVSNCNRGRRGRLRIVHCGTVDALKRYYQGFQ